jgi:UDP-N-acetylmuramoyl-tripeptide--D-alanyl-D-alanine ligase
VAWVALALCLLAAAVAAVRWLRVAQREHYLAGSSTRFARRWWTAGPLNLLLGAVALGTAVASWWVPAVALGTAAVVAAGPIGLGVRGRTSPLRWTRRLRTLAAVSALLAAAAVGLGAAFGVAPVAAAAVAVLVPVIVDAACLLLTPLESALAGRYVGRAADRLARVRPTVVGITGSYGKTSTKGHVAQLLGPGRAVVASPASFNNRAGLARAINESVADGTEVFVAEMGTYGVGEIAELCRWCPPDVAVITAIGPVHLERFGSEEEIVRAKSEILAPAGTVVLPVDDHRLAALADRAESAGKTVRRCSVSDRGVDVCVERAVPAGGATEAGRRGPLFTVYVDGEPVAKDVPAPAGVQPSNLACALAVALVLGVDARTAADRIGDLRGADHRLSLARAPSGVVVVDDTYNSNPSGARVALDAVVAAADGGADRPDDRARRIAVVTPGMVELGPRQADENARFATEVARRATDLVVVGRTNSAALRRGAASAASPIAVHAVRHRDEAVDWVRRTLGPGDAVLYENDLPDHYP